LVLGGMDAPAPYRKLQQSLYYSDQPDVPDWQAFPPLGAPSLSLVRPHLDITFSQPVGLVRTPGLDHSISGSPGSQASDVNRVSESAESVNQLPSTLEVGMPMSEGTCQPEPTQSPTAIKSYKCATAQHGTGVVYHIRTGLTSCHSLP